MISDNNSDSIVWKIPIWMWVVFCVLIILTIVIFYDGLKSMVGIWSSKEEYGYGYLIPVISVFLIWQKRDVLDQLKFPGSWLGLAVALLGIALYFLGELSTLYIIIQYAFVIVIAGLALSFIGWQAFKYIWVAFFLLLFMIPLPQFLYQSLSSELQLASSELGVAVIRLFGISVFLEGNVIDLGAYKLQVVEACSGLRYLFPLATLSFIAAYLFKGAFWKKAVIFLSSMPITVIMNSIRIGIIGVLVEYGGIGMAEGFLHYFEGWVIFMACMLLLVGEMWLLAKIGKQKLSLTEAFGIELPAPTPKDAQVSTREISKPFVITSVLICGSLLGLALIDENEQISPQRNEFSSFPMTIEGGWQGKSDQMEAVYLDVLKLDDYLLADFIGRDEKTINLYVAYYASQSKGESVHSPRSCIPGGGWQITSFSQKPLADTLFDGGQLRVNRAIIQKGEYKQLVYYWFQQRGRNITNEYLVKWYLFWDALTRKRSDGALVRLTAFVNPDDSIEEADKRLSTFAASISATLEKYIPD